MIRIAFYGKGGIGKSTTVSNLSQYWASLGMTVLQIGCDPKADSTLSLRDGKKIPTVMDMVRKRVPFDLEDVIYVKHTGRGRIICAEAGGPMPGRGCAGRGIITALETLRDKDILSKYSPDVILYDVLGDVVCGGFAMPMREGYADRVYILTSGENMAIYAAANIGLAVENFKERGYAQLGGLILNRRNVKREEEKVLELSQDLHTQIVGSLDRSELVQEAEELGETVISAFPESAIADSYRALADRIASDCEVDYPVTKDTPAQTNKTEITETSSEGPSRIPVSKTSFPAPFAQELEFNPPVHETWNIVHIGMLMPQAHQIYICSDNCMRGVVMTAAEMNAIERFSCVVLEEKDMHSGNLEEITLEGVSDVLLKIRRKRGEEGLPKAVLVFPVCLHHFMGCDLGYVYKELEKRFPQIVFIKGWMDPIMQKTGPSPDMKLRKAMMDILMPYEEKNGLSALIGDIYALDPESDLMRLIRAADEVRGTVSTPLQIQDCETLKEYQALSGREVLITRSPMSAVSVRQTARRLGCKGLYLPAVMDYAGIRKELETAAEALGITSEQAGISFEQEETLCEDALQHLRDVVGDTPIAIDYIAVQRPLGFARLLLERGFAVREVYLDAVSPEEENDFLWLKENHGEVLLCSTIHVNGRLLHAGAIDSEHSGFLAVGPKAAWFCGTEHFVNLVDYGGMWGYSGIRKMASLMEDAFENAKDTKDLVPRKGLGCESILF